MPKTQPPYSFEFRRQMITLARAAGDPEHQEAGIRPSIGSVGNAYDKAMRELRRYLRMRDLGSPPVCFPG